MTSKWGAVHSSNQPIRSQLPSIYWSLYFTGPSCKAIATDRFTSFLCCRSDGPVDQQRGVKLCWKCETVQLRCNNSGQTNKSSIRLDGKSHIIQIATSEQDVVNHTPCVFPDFVSRHCKRNSNNIEWMKNIIAGFCTRNIWTRYAIIVNRKQTPLCGIINVVEWMERMCPTGYLRRAPSSYLWCTDSD